MSKQPIFDEWEGIQECNECTNYWNESCDGTPVGSERHCTAFKAVRSTDIPLRLKRVEKRVKTLTIVVVCKLGLDICALIGGLLLGKI